MTSYFLLIPLVQWRALVFIKNMFDNVVTNVCVVVVDLNLKDVTETRMLNVNKASQQL